MYNINIPLVENINLGLYHIIVDLIQKKKPQFPFYTNH